MQWIEIVRTCVRESRERGDADQQVFIAQLGDALGERSLPPALSHVMARARAGKYKSINGAWRALDEVCAQTGRGAIWAVLGVAIATLFGFLVAYGC